MTHVSGPVFASKSVDVSLADTMELGRRGPLAFDALSFATAPVDMGVVFPDTVCSSSLDLVVHRSTFVLLTIEDDTSDGRFNAELKEKVKVPPGRKVLHRNTPSFTEDVAVAAGERTVLTIPEAVAERLARFGGKAVGAHMLAVGSSHGAERAVTYRLVGAGGPVAPAEPAKSVSKERALDPNVHSGDKYRIAITFDSYGVASDLPRNYSAKLVVAYEDVVAHIPITVCVGYVELKLVDPKPLKLAMGDTATVWVEARTVADRPSMVTVPSQQPQAGVSVATQDVALNPVDKVIAPLTIKTSPVQNPAGKVFINWKVAFDGDEMVGVPPIQLPVVLSPKPPLVSVTSSLTAYQGDQTPLHVSLTSQGPATVVQIWLDGLPAGVTASPLTATLGLNAQQTFAVLVDVAQGAGLSDTSPVPVSLFVATYDGTHLIERSIMLRVDDPFDMQNQSGTLWCWAALTASVFDFYGGLVLQCTVVEEVAQLANCCGGAVPPSCDVPGNIEQTLTFFDLFAQKLGPLSPSQIREQIDAGRPIVVRIAWAGQQVGHVVAITGYVDSGADQLLLVEDPSGPVESVLPLETLLNSYGDGTGSWDYTVLTKPPTSVPG